MTSRKPDSTGTGRRDPVASLPGSGPRALVVSSPKDDAGSRCNAGGSPPLTIAAEAEELSAKQHLTYAHARTLLPNLAAEVRRLVKELDEARNEAESWRREAMRRGSFVLSGFPWEEGQS